MILTENAISAVQALDGIRQLIENGQGDVGRLRYVCECIQKGKPLYRSDRLYLEKKIGLRIVFEEPQPPSESDELAKSIQKLLRLRTSFPERLQFMLNRIAKGKPLFRSDLKYLEKKLAQVPDRYKRSKRPAAGFAALHAIPALKEGFVPKRGAAPGPIPDRAKEELRIARDEISRLRQDLAESQERIRSLESTIERKNREIESRDAEIKRLSSQRPKTAADNPLEEGGPELNRLRQKSIGEAEKIDRQTPVSEQIRAEKEKLEQLISYREECESRIMREKKILKNRINLENQKIAEKERIIEEITSKQEQLKQNRIEREAILRQVREEQARLEEQIAKQSEELDRAKEKYGSIADRQDDPDGEAGAK